MRLASHIFPYLRFTMLQLLSEISWLFLKAILWTLIDRGASSFLFCLLKDYFEGIFVCFRLWTRIDCEFDSFVFFFYLKVIY